MQFWPTLKYFHYKWWYFLMSCAVFTSASNYESETNRNLLHKIKKDLTEMSDKYHDGHNSNVGYESLGLRSKRQYDNDRSDSSLWHSYRFGTGTGNREVLRVSGVHKENWLGEGCSGDGVWSWQSLEIGRNRGLLLGLGLDFLTLCSYSSPYLGTKQDNGNPAYNATEFKLGVFGLPTAAAMFQTWNETSKMTDVVIVVALDFNDKLPVLVWYRVMNDGKPILLQLPTAWALQKSVWYLQSFKIKREKKLLVLNHPKDNRTDTSVDLHGFIWEEGGKMDFWLVQKLFVHASSSVAIVNVGETTFLGISQPDGDLIKLYQFDYVDHKFQIFQEIKVASVSKLISFYVGFSSFIAVAGKEPMLLRYDKEEFVTEKIDGIERLGPVLHWLPIPIRTYRDEVVLLVETEANKQRLISVVTWIGGHPGFSLLDPPLCYMNGDVAQGLWCLLDPMADDSTLIYGLESAAALSLGRWNPGLIIPRSYGPSVLFRLEASLESVPSPVEKEVALLKEIQQELNAIINEQFHIIKEARNALEETLDFNGPNVITGSWDIAVLEASKVEVSDIGSDSGLKFLDVEEDHSNWKFGGLPWSAEEVPSIGREGLNSLGLKLESLASSIENMKSEVADAVPLVWDGDDPIVITAPQTFQGTIVVEGKMIANDMHIDKLNGVSVEEILSNTVRLDKQKKITGHKVLKSLFVDNLTVLHKLGTINVSSLVFSDDEHVVLEGLTYQNELKVYGDVVLPEGGTVNDVDLSEEVVAVNGTYDFGLEFSGTLFADNVWTETINNFPVTEEYFNSIMRENGETDEQIVESTLLMKYLEADGEKVKIENINGQDFKNFLSRLVFTDQGGYIPGETFVKECHALKDIDIKSLNDLSFPDEYVRTSGSKQVITGRKTFMSGNKDGSLRANVLELSGLVNGLNTSDFITLSTDQDLRNTSFYFTELEVDDLQVEENIEDVAAEDYGSPPVFGELNEVLLDLYFRDIEVKGDFIVKGLMNGKTWQDVLGDIIYDDDDNVVISASKIIIKELEVGSLSLDGFINGLNVSGFLTNDTEQTFVGKKIIGGKTTFKNVEVKDGLVDGVDIAYLSENAIRLSGQVWEGEEPDPESVAQKMHGSIVFEQEVFVSPSLVAARINDFSPEDVAFVNRDQVFTGDAVFDSLHADIAYVGGDFDPKKTISGINLEEFDAKRFSLTRPQEIGEDVEVYIKNAVIDGDLNVNSINGVILDELDGSSLIASEGAANITYHIENMKINGTVKTNGIGPYNLNDIRENAIWIDRDNFIKGEIIFEDEVTFGNLKVEGSVNGYDLNAFLEDIVMKGEDAQISGKKVFTAGFKVGDIDTSLLNGIPVEDILTTNTYQEINEPLRIRGNVIVEGKLKIANGKVNGIELSEFAERYEWRNGLHVLKGDVVVDGSTTIDNLKVSGSVNNVNWEEFLESVAFINDDIQFSGNITFNKKVVFGKDLFVSQTIDGIDMDAMFGPSGSAVLLGSKGAPWNRFSHGVIDGPVRFKGDVVVNGALKVYGDMTAERVYGCDLRKWAEEAIFLDQSSKIPGVITFKSMSAESNVEIRFANGVDLTKVIFLNKDQVFDKQLNFEYLSIPNGTDVPVGNLVNGLNLMEEYKNTLLVEGDQIISGQKIFVNHVKVRGDVITEGTINDICTDMVVTLHTDQDITGLVKADHFVVNEDVRVVGLVNEKDFNQWVELGVCKDGPRSSISGSWTVKGNVSFHGEDVLGKGTLDGVDVSQFYELTSLSSDTQQNTFKEIMKNMTSICEDLKYIEERTMNQPFLFNGLEAVQKIHSKHGIQSMFHFSALDEEYLAISFSLVCGGELYIWNPTNTNFDLVGNLNFAGGSKWHHFGTVEDDVILIVSSDEDGRKCEHTGYNVWRFVPELQQFDHVQNLGNFKSAQLLATEDSDDNLFYTLGDSGVDKWALNEDGLLEKIQSWDINGEYLSLIPEGGQDILVINEDKEATKLNGEKVKDLHDVYRTESFVILNISDKLSLLAYTENEATVIEGITDYVKAYDLNDGNLFTKIPSLNPSSLISMDFGHRRQKMLAFLEDSTKLKMFEYKGVEGFVEHLSFKIKCSKLISMSLQVRNLFSRHNFILALSETSVIVFEAEMLGDPIHEFSSLECPSQ